MNTSVLKKIVLIIFVAGTVLAIQCVRIHRPYFGHFSSYQIVSASMARNMLKENFSELLLPKTDFMIGKKKSMPLNQYPFHSLFAAAGARVFGGSIEFWGRFQAIVFSLLSVLLIGLIAASVFSPLAGWVSACLAAFSPFTLIYGQAFMSESSSLFFMLLSVYLLLAGSRRGEGAGLWRSAIAGFFFSLAVTGRIHFLLILPVLAGRILFAGDAKKTRIVPAGVFLLCAMALPLAWYVFTYFVSIRSDNIHTNLFLQLSGRKLGDQNYLMNPDYYRHVFDILTEKFVTPLAFPFIVLGCLLSGGAAGKDPGRDRVALVWGIILGALMIFLFPQKVMVHEFYLYVLFPFAVIFCGLGISRMMEAFPVLRKGTVILLLMILYLACSSRYFLHPIFKYPSEDKKILPMAEAIRENSRPDDWFIVLGRGFSESVYYADRPSWDMNLDLVGKPLAYFFKDPRFSGADFKKLDALENAMKDPVTWLNYLKDQGARYLIAPRAGDLSGCAVLESYIREHFKKIPTSQDLFFYDLSKAPQGRPEHSVSEG
jgi:hypothetical protein